MRYHAFLYISILCGGALFLAASCQRPEDIPPTNIDKEAEYFVVGALNGDSIVFEAGKNNVIHDTYHDTDDFGTVVYYSRFIEQNCNMGCREIIFRLTDIPVSVSFESGQLTGLDTSIIQFAVPNHPQTILLSASLDNVNALDSSQFTWVYNSGAPLNLDSLEIPVITGEPFNLCLEGLSPQGCSYSQCIEAVIGNHAPCYTDLVISGSQQHLVIEAIPNGIPPYTFDWGNGHTGPTFQFNIEPTSGVNYQLTVTDHAGTVNIINHAFHAQEGLINNCIPDFSLDLHQGPGLTNSQFGAMVIEYREGDGNIYRSDWFPQPVDAGFIILDAAELTDVPGGSSGLKLSVRFSCFLYSDNGEALQFESEQAVIAFSRLP